MAFTGVATNPVNGDFTQQESASFAHAPVSTLGAPISDVDEIVAGMCAFEPGERYDTLSEALEYLNIIG